MKNEIHFKINENIHTMIWNLTKIKLSDKNIQKHFNRANLSPNSRKKKKITENNIQKNSFSNNYAFNHPRNNYEFIEFFTCIFK